MIRKNLAAVLTTFLLIFALETPVMAATNSKVGAIWNEATGETTYYDPAKFPQTKTVKTKLSNEELKLLQKAKEVKPGEITINAWVSYFDKYVSDSNVINWENKYVGVYRYDNRNNKYTTVNVQYEASESGTWEGSLALSFEGSGEINAAIAEINAKTGITATGKRSWTTGYKYGAVLPVPPLKVGYIYAYIPGIATSGYKYYKNYDTYNSSSYYYTKQRVTGSVAPMANSWNNKGVIQNY